MVGRVGGCTSGWVHVFGCGNLLAGFAKSSSENKNLAQELARLLALVLALVLVLVHRQASPVERFWWYRFVIKQMPCGQVRTKLT